MRQRRRVRVKWIGAGSVLLAVVAIFSLLVAASSGQATLTAETYADVIRFGVQGAGTLEIQIYDLSEKELWDSGAISSDFVDWDRTDMWGERLANGYYMYLAQAWDMSGSLILSKTGKVALLPGDQVQLQAAPAVQNPGATSGTFPIPESPLQTMGLGDTGVFNIVGIGTASPSSKLHIYASWPEIKLEDPGTGSPQMSFYSGGSLGGFFQYKQTTNSFRFGNYKAGGDVRLLSGGNNERMTISSAGNVGIGTTSPAAKLDVYSTSTVSGTTDGIVNIGPSAGNHLAFDGDDIQAKNGLGGEDDLFLNYFGGNVAVGWIFPTYRLDVEGDRIRLNSPSDSRQVMLRVDGAANDLQAENADLYVRSAGGYDIHMNPYTTDGVVYVGGTDKSGTGLYVTSTDATADAVTVLIDNTDPFGDLLAGQNGTDREFFFDYAGNLYLDGTHNSPADFAELMRAEESPNALEPGDVLVMLPTGKLALSSAPYSASLVGVYSTKPGVLGDYTSMEMAEDESDTTTEARKAAEGPRVPVALLGIVRVKVCAENGAIRPGDVLTTSSTPGHAMKASPVVVSGVQIYPTGAILGKALEPLETGTGTILALITLR